MSNETKAWIIKIGTTIREHRDMKSWDQDALAKDAHISRKTLSVLENGSRSCGIGKIVDTMLALGIDPWTFFGGSVKNRPKRKIQHEVLHDKLDEILSSGREELFMTVWLLLRGLTGPPS